MRKILLTLIAALCCAVVTNAQEIANWSGWRTAAATFTFDDGAPSHVDTVGPLFDHYGYKATFNLVVNWDPDWEGFQTLVNNGHEIGSHSINHNQNMTGEEQSSKDSINAHITGQDCNTVAYPNCNVPNESVVLQNYIAGRICFGSWIGIDNYMGKDGPDNWTRVPSLITGAAEDIKTTSDFVSAFQKVIQTNGWVVFMTHGMQGMNNGNANFSPTDINAIDGALNWASQHDKEIWITTFRNAAMYCKERQAATFALVADGASQKTYSLTHEISDAVSQYDYPLSLRIPTPDGWTTAYVNQAGRQIESQIEDGYVYFDAIPNGGEIVVDKTAEAIDNVNAVKSATKRVENGVLLIERNGRTYTAQGAEVK